MKKIITFLVMGIVLILFNAPSVNAQCYLGVAMGYANYTGLHKIPYQDIYIDDGNFNGPFATNSNGFAISSQLNCGTTVVSVDQSFPWGGVNALDAMLIINNFTQMSLPFTWDDRRTIVGDVNGSGGLFPNSVDAMKIAQRFLHQINDFSVGSWYVDQSNGDPAIILTDACEYCEYDYYLGEYCYGDVNYNYAGQFAKTKPLVNLITSGVMHVKSGESFDVPIITLDKIDVGAISMVLNIPPNKFDFVGFTMPDQVDDSSFYYDFTDGVLRIVWWDVYGVELDANDIFMTLTLTAKVPEWYNTIGGIIIEGESEIADKDGLTLADVELVQPKIVVSHSISDNPDISSSPNPANQNVEFNYFIPVDGNVSIKIFNAFGQEVAQVVNKTQSANTYHMNFAVSSMPSGIYTYSLIFNDYVKTKKLVIAR